MKMFDEWRKGILKKKRDVSTAKFYSVYPEEEREKKKQENKRDYVEKQKEFEVNYKKWQNLEDLERKQWIKELAEDCLKSIKQINRKWFWRHPFSSIWTDVYFKWFNWFYMLPEQERIGKNDEEFIKSLIASSTNRWENIDTYLNGEENEK